MLFVLSPEAVKSEACARELAHAVRHHKFLIPLVDREVAAEQVPAPLAALNWLFLREGDQFEPAFAAVLAALDADLDWVHAHTRLLTRAIEWDHRGHDDSLLLRGRNLPEAERRLAQVGPEQDPQPTALKRQYLLASRHLRLNLTRVACTTTRE